MQTTNAALRGLGRQAYRNGLNVVQAVSWAARQVGTGFNGREIVAVMDGWKAERTEAND